MTDIEALIARKQWAKARDSIHEALEEAPTDHWLWLTLSLTYYEENKYEKALQCSQRAVELQPSCPLALWHLAGALFMNDREDAALVIWTLLRTMDLEAIAYDECGEGMDWALQLVNDVHYRIARYYQWKEEHELARHSFAKYLHNREHGVGSIYNKEQVEEYLARSALGGDSASGRPAKRKQS
jgi:tetratricopeptide (TPR) repeat protein